MSTTETILGFLGAGGGLSGIGAIVKTAFDRSDLKRKLEKLETETLPAFEKKVAEALVQFPALERRASDAIVKLETAIRSSGRASRSGTGADSAQLGAAVAELTALRREIEAMKGPVEANRTAAALALQRLDAIEERFGNFETAYHEDYGELREKVAGVAGEFKQAMRAKNAIRPSTDSG